MRLRVSVALGLATRRPVEPRWDRATRRLARRPRGRSPALVLLGLVERQRLPIRRAAFNHQLDAAFIFLLKCLFASDSQYACL